MKVHALCIILLLFVIILTCGIVYNKSSIELTCEQEFIPCPEVISISTFKAEPAEAFSITKQEPIRVMPELQYDFIHYDNIYEWSSDYDSFEAIEVLEYEPTPTPAPVQTLIVDNHDKVCIKNFTQNIFDVNSLDSYGRQRVVDNENSAAYFTYDGHTNIIGDHVNQGFSIIKSLSTGDVVSTIIGGVTKNYSVIGIDGSGVNNGLLYYSDGRSATVNNSATLLLYTCNEGTYPRTITIVSCVDY